ncbi:MAG: cadmium-translocating P-type ATPase [Erysipelotrichaceae bacterium]|nr:cadmium-translocating P-type ATPase [Erysipelotrichaceae bacterium]
MTKKQKKNLQRIAIAFVLYLVLAAGSHLFEINKWVQLAGYLAIYLYIASDILKKTWKNILARDFMDENFLMAAASLGAFVLGEYSEAVAVILFYQIGEWFQSYAVARSRKNIADLMDIRPEYANLVTDEGVEEVDPDQVKVGSIILIKPGERVPLDGTVIEGTSTLDTSALTGESVPRSVSAGKDVISGCINQNGLLKVKVTREYSQSTVSRILEMVENATDKKSRSEQFITRFARIYTPAVVYSAVALAIIPSLITGQWNVWVYRALEFLVISCPCALVISVPLSFFGGIGGASKCGILVKGSNYLQEFSQVKTMVFDKTGTLTKGTFQVTNIFPVGMNSEDLLQLAARAESFSTHPIAQSILKAAGMQPNQGSQEDVQEIAGHGVKALIDGSEIYVGNAKLMAQAGVREELSKGSGFGTVVYVSRGNAYLGMIEVADEVKEDAKTVITLLRKQGVNKFVMLTGDDETVATAVAGSLGIDEVHAKLLPEQKVEQVEKLLADQPKGQSLAFVGDGINDAPVLTRADVGVAMGALGSDAAIEAADIVLMDDQLDGLVTARAIANKTLSIATQNIVFAIGVKLLMLVLGAFGIVNMWGAVFADTGVSFICILNSIRALNVKKINANGR